MLQLGRNLELKTRLANTEIQSEIVRGVSGRAGYCWVKRHNNAPSICMKPRLTQAPAPAEVLLLIASLFIGISLPAFAADAPNARPRPNPAPVAPIPPAAPGAPPPIPASPAAPAPDFSATQVSDIDPATGLPMPPWVDPNWPDPGKLLPEINYDALPLEHVALQLRQDFKNAFDVLIPNQWQHPADASITVSPGMTPVRLQLRNVSATEIFFAMNLMFATENSPYRWELRMNGNRPIAMLRVLPQLLPAALAPPPPPPPVTRMVHFVGDLVDGNPSASAMEDLVKTVSDIYQKAHGSPKSVIQFHKESQLLIITGTGEQIGFVQLTLSALREKARFKQLAAPQPNPAKDKTEEIKPQ